MEAGRHPRPEPGRELAQGGAGLETDWARERAAGMERAARRQPAELGQRAGDRRGGPSGSSRSTTAPRSPSV